MHGACTLCKLLLGMPRPAALAPCSATLLNKLPYKMELVKIQGAPALRNAPKGLSSGFHPIRSKTKGTLIHETTNGNDPLRAKQVLSVVSQLRRLCITIKTYTYRYLISANAISSSGWVIQKGSFFPSYSKFRRR